MKISKSVSAQIKARIENGIKVQKVFVQRLDARLYEYCIDMSNKTTKLTWTGALMLLLYPNIGNCETCGSLTRFFNLKKGFQRFCSSRCRANSPEQIAMTKNRLHTQKVRGKIEKTNIKLYGGISPFCAKATVHKCQKSLNKRSDVQKNIDKAKRNATMLERYGVEHNMQSRALFEKQKLSGFKIKKFKLKGKTFKVRGYEDIAIRYLHKKYNVAVSDIKTTSAEGMPTIRYLDSDGKKHMYHPDIYARIKNKWWLIEVKSTYTCGITAHKKNGMFGTLRRKIKACVDSGYRTRVLIITKEHKVHVVANIYEKKRSQVRAEIGIDR